MEEKEVQEEKKEVKQEEEEGRVRKRGKKMRKTDYESGQIVHPKKFILLFLSA